MKRIENFRKNLDRGLALTSILSLLLLADRNLAQAEAGSHGSQRKNVSQEMEHAGIISAREVIQRLIKYVQERGQVHVDGREDAKANLLARVMISEEGGHEDKAHYAVLIAWTVLNRLQNKENFSSADLKNVITGGKDFGLQSGGRQFSSNRDPVTLPGQGGSKSGGVYRVLASAILAGYYDDYDFGQENFMHVGTQNKLAEAGKAKPASQVAAEWAGAGLEEIPINGVDPHYIKFFKPKK